MVALRLAFRLLSLPEVCHTGPDAGRLWYQVQIPRTQDNTLFTR